MDILSKKQMSEEDLLIQSNINQVNLLYTFPAFCGITKGIINVFDDHFSFSSNKGNFEYKYLEIKNVKMDTMGNMEVTTSAGKIKYTSTDERIKELAQFIGQQIYSELEKDRAVISTSKPSFADGFRVGYASGYDNKKNNDEDFVEKITRLPYADTWGTKRDIKEMGKMLQEGEEVKAVASGFFDGRTWMFACTDRRVLAINKNLLIGGDQIEIPFRQIHAVVIKKGLMMSTVSVQTGVRTMDISNILNESARYFVDCVHKGIELLDNKWNNTNVVQQVNQTSVADEIRKFKELMDDGIITQEEFDAKKKQLLDI